jgi:cupin 2 domain-containing protein
MNILDLPSPQAPQARQALRASQELYETLAAGDSILIERIISRGHTTPAGEWFDSEEDEWVLLLRGEAVIAYIDGSLTIIKTGDYLLIPAHQKHRVEFTSSEPPCIWLAVHGKMTVDPISEGDPQPELQSESRSDEV